LKGYIREDNVDHENKPTRSAIGERSHWPTMVLAASAWAPGRHLLGPTIAP
jgi:hypothetical protein